jgi:hypothetical protein
MITFESRGSFKKTESFLASLSKQSIPRTLEKYARQGVSALESSTPEESGLTATSWDYEITSSRGSYSIVWTNDNIVDGVPVAILLQYGHGTGTGGYVQGKDFINPAIKPIFDQIAQDVWKAVTNA